MILDPWGAPDRRQHKDASIMIIQMILMRFAKGGGLRREHIIRIDEFCFDLVTI